MSRMSDLAAQRDASLYRICRGCDTVPCTHSPGECEEDARISAGDRKYHEQREG